MSIPKSTSRQPAAGMIVDLTDLESPDAGLLSPFTLAPPALRSVTHSALSTRTSRKAARRGDHLQDVVVDLMDDSDSDSEVKMIPGFCMPRGRKASKIYKVDPNESPLQRDEVNLDPRILNAFVTGTSEVVAVRTIPPPNPETQVLDVFPDADLLAVKIMLNERGNNAAAVIEYMSEHKYPKAEGPNIATKSLCLAVNDAKEWMYDYTSAESFTPTYDYIAQATDLLLCDFPFLSKMGATSFMSTYRNHYALCHKALFEAVKGTGDDSTQYNRVLDSSKKKPLKDDQKHRISSLLKYCKSPTVKTPIRRNKVLITDKVLQDERQYVTSKVQEWMDAQKVRENRELNKKISQRDGTAVECSCCFDSYPFQDMISCSDVGHLFCLDCIKSFTENLIFGNGNLGVNTETKKLAIELQCFHGDGCNSGFSRAFLQKALPTKSMEKYDEIQCEISIKLAGLVDMCSCPKCGFQADVPSGQKVFECPVATCLYASCRECGEAAHIPLRCDEIEKEKVTKGRLAVEEAITDAKVRRCPTCKKSFIKDSGCNKITCGCGTKVCYLCQAKIKDYSHFCQTPHCDHKEKCSKCPLYTNAEEDDVRAMRAAGFAAAEKVKETVVGTEVTIDVNSILNSK